jgi:hypothetical protein
MTGNGYLQIGFYLAALLLFAWPLGIYMAASTRETFRYSSVGCARSSVACTGWPASAMQTRCTGRVMPSPC